MNTGSTIGRALVAATGLLMLAACMDHPPPPRHPGPYKNPVDAFDATDAPYDPSGPQGASGPLSGDLAHLRDAREAYEHSQAVQAAQRRDQQEKCRQQPNAKLVHINDGTGDPDAVYCQTPPDEPSSDSDGQ
ncbi:hypothetical protein [Salinisphaera hydrothermalis]|uniref:hypothetical protein n=1 Tax=Salinisphaera hydrothermalis TaxID=563188 RepID=UPI0012EBC96F|nr:hypothetical protein [Salinisphaera hydrothermalis]